jgi:NitT/TauT family transport system ATP-binding protein
MSNTKNEKAAVRAAGAATPQKLNVEHARIEYLHPVTRTAFCAVRDVSFDVGSHDIVAVVGPSGCGKSTLLGAIAGLVPYTGGSIEITGTPVRRPRRESSMVFQKPALLPWRTALDNVAYPLTLRRMKKAEARQRAAEALDRVGLHGFAAYYPHQLSGGMQQRVSVARALATEPQLLLLDEPFAALDAQMREVLQEEVLTLLEDSSLSGVLVTHQIDEAVLLGDRVVVLSAGPESYVKEIIDIPLPRPRNPEVRNSPEFLELVAEVSRLVRHELVESQVPAGA